MKKHIDVDILIKKMTDRHERLVKDNGYYDHYTQGYEDALDAVENEPTADVEEVVRCKDCKYCKKFVDDFGVAKYFCVYFCGSQKTKQDGYCHRGRKNEQVH